ncbi:stalk domain-containing protein [Cohnella cellulosilytica]|uniref:Stalk domain-containing protein n=1 Tax=Cohnella cellulosilytica TaxID=986710 RepID=A0ABW2F4V5_9BACL
MNSFAISGFRKAVRTACLLLSVLLSVACVGREGATAIAAAKTVTVYYNNQEIAMQGGSPVIQNGTTLVPFRPLLETLGFKVGWTKQNGLSIVTGTKEGLEIRLTIDSRSAAVNGRSVTLDVPAQIVSGQTLVPLRFVSEYSGYEVSYSGQGKSAVIRISDKGKADNAGSGSDGKNAGTGNAAGGPDGKGQGSGNGGTQAGGNGGASSAGAEPYVLKGIVVDSDGHPVKGAKIYADNQLLYNSNEVGVTDANGRYRIELEKLAATWHASGEATVELNGQSSPVKLTPDNDDPFAGNAGAVRNFTLRTATGSVIFHMADLWNPQDITLPPPAQEDVELTLVPVGDTAGGTAQPYIGRGQVTNDGFGMTGVPIGRYKVSARYVPEGEPAQTMLVRPSRGGEYQEAMEAEFVHVIASFYKIEIEVKLP